VERIQTKVAGDSWQGIGRESNQGLRKKYFPALSGDTKFRVNAVFLILRIKIKKKAFF
jgi:hypothetical protein